MFTILEFYVYLLVGWLAIWEVLGWGILLECWLGVLLMFCAQDKAMDGRMGYDIKMGNMCFVVVTLAICSEEMKIVYLCLVISEGEVSEEV